MIKIHKFLFLLCLFLFSSQAIALDNFYVATENPQGTNVIKVFSNSGFFLGEIPIPDSFKTAQFISGRWIRGQLSIMALKKNNKTNSVSSYIINERGNSVKEFSIGKKIKKVIALDFNDNGIQDLAVQGRKGVIVYLDPSISSATTKVRLGKYSDAVATQTSTGTSISSLKLEVMNKNFLDSITAPQKLSASNNFVTYKKQVRKRKFKNFKIGIKTTVQRVFPLKVENSEDPNFVIQSSARKLELIGKNFRNSTFSKNRNSKFFTGFFTSEKYSDIAIGQKLDDASGIATIRIINPSTREERTVRLDFNFKYSYNSNEFSTFATNCTEINRLYNQLLKAYNSGNYNEYLRIYYLIIAIPNHQDCINNDDSGGDNGGGDDNDDNQDGKTEDDDGYFSSANSINYITNVVQYGSNTGMARTPCNDIRSAKDGKNGFLAKNSDFHPGVVYLTPGASYQNGRILNASTFRVMSKVPFDTVANGGRAHFRLSSVRLPFGPHIFAADNGYGETICWKVPGGLTRVD